jgi:cytochrome c
LITDLHRCQTMLRLIFTILLLTCGAGAPAQDELPDGRALVRQFCAGCHATGRFGRSPKEGAPPLRTLGSRYDIEELVKQLENGLLSSHPDMPTFKASPEAARAIGSYLQSIQE